MMQTTESPTFYKLIKHEKMIQKIIFKTKGTYNILFDKKAYSYNVYHQTMKVHKI